MKDASEWSAPKWPFLSATVLLLGVAGWVVQRAAHPITEVQIILVVSCVVLAAIAGILPFLLDYKAIGKLVEINALGTVAEELQNLEKYASQVSAATNQWAMIQESTQAGATKTTTAAKELADRMTNEVRNFNEFQVKLNEGEKQMLRLEVEKLRRVEGDWLQVTARVLDNIYALYLAAERSGQPEIASQIGQFQTACREATRRVGLTTYVGEPGDSFDAERFRAHGVENPPAEAKIAETLAVGFQFQGRLIRPALVRLQTEAAAEPAPAPVAASEPPPEPQPESETAPAPEPVVEQEQTQTAPAPAPGEEVVQIQEQVTETVATPTAPVVVEEQVQEQIETPVAAPEAPAPATEEKPTVTAETPAPAPEPSAPPEAEAAAPAPKPRQPRRPRAPKPATQDLFGTEPSAPAAPTDTTTT
jgi:molecular chaperone GrpE (heat shock protein)